MPRNVEIKARVGSLPVLLHLIGSCNPVHSDLLQQRDVFFNTRDPAERLKLRVENDGASAKLIWYARPNRDGPKLSDYRMCRVEQPEAFIDVMRRSVGVRGEVRKTRVLYIVGQTRVHVDTVAGLGDFMELEVMLRDEQTEADGEAIARDLMRRLCISEADLVEEAYIDLLLKKPQ